MANDKLDEWISEAKTDGLHPESAKWVYRLARAKGLAVVADRTLQSLESVQRSLDYSIVMSPTDAQRQMIMQHAPHPEQFKKAQEDLAEATSLIALAELILEFAQRRSVVSLHALGKPEEKKPGARFGK